MNNGILANSLIVVSYRIATEPGFIQKLRDLLPLRRLDTGQPISENDAAAIEAYLEQDAPLPLKLSDWVDESDPLETWWG